MVEIQNFKKKRNLKVDSHCQTGNKRVKQHLQDLRENGVERGTCSEFSQSGSKRRSSLFWIHEDSIYSPPINIKITRGDNSKNKEAGGRRQWKTKQSCSPMGRRQLEGRRGGHQPGASGGSRQWPSGENRVPFLFLGSNPKSTFCG